METSLTTSSSVNNSEEEKHKESEKMQIDVFAEASCSSGLPPPRVPSPMITVSEVSEERVHPPPPPPILLTPTRDRKKSPASGVTPRQRKRSQPVRGDLLPDPDKLLSYKHHDKKEDEVLEDPTVPGGQPKPPEPRQPGQAAERKRSTVTFCPVIETIEK